MSPAKFDFGPVLRRRRADLRISQGALAERTGLSQNYVSLLESGRRLPSLDTLAAIAAQLNVPPSYLVMHAQVLEPERESQTPATLADELKSLADRLVELSDARHRD
jgi:transcriptional regulator with XRE-family HTH domain